MTNQIYINFSERLGKGLITFSLEWTYIDIIITLGHTGGG